MSCSSPKFSTIRYIADVTLNPLSIPAKSCVQAFVNSGSKSDKNKSPTITHIFLFSILYGLIIFTSPAPVTIGSTALYILFPFSPHSLSITLSAHNCVVKLHCGSASTNSTFFPIFSNAYPI